MPVCRHGKRSVLPGVGGVSSLDLLAIWHAAGPFVTEALQEELLMLR